MKLRLIAGSVVLFIIALGFNIFFNMTSIDKLYIETILSKYHVVTKDIRRSIERGLQYNKKIEKYYNIEKSLANNINTLIKNKDIQHKNAKKSFSQLDNKNINIFITDKNGFVLYKKNENKSISTIPETVLKRFKKIFDDPKQEHTVKYIKHDKKYYSLLPIQNGNSNLVGTIAITINEKAMKEFLNHVFETNIRPTIFLSMIGIISLIGLLIVLIPNEKISNKFSKKKTSITVFIVIGTVLIFTCGVSTFKFSKYFMEINKENVLLINKQLKRDVQFLLDTGVRIDRLSKLDLYLGKIISESPDIENITLFDHTDQPLYRATKKKVTDFQRSKDAYESWVEATKPIKNPEYNVKGILEKDNEYKGYFSINASKDILFKKLIDNVMDSLTVIIISMLFFIEMLILIFKYFERRLSGSLENQSTDYSVMRPAAFLFLFGIDISVSFLPLHMENLYIPILNLSKETIMGLPISVEFLFVGIAILISGVWLDRRGWHEPFISGLIIAATGVLYSWLAPDAVHFILSRAVVGFGYGLSLMAAQGFVINFTDWKTKAQGLAHLFAGIYAGSICGTATGGMLAEWIGYAPVFFIGAIILASVIIYALLFMRNAMEKPVYEKEKVKTENEGGMIFFRFVFNRTILGLIFFSSLPAAIAVIGFLNYFSPIYLNRIGASQSTIGQVLMLYGICLIYFGPYISRYVDASNNKKVYILLGCFLGSMALLTFYFFEGLFAAIIAVILLGISSSFVLASQSVYALKLRVTKELGEGKAIGIFRSTSRVGQMLGPIVFSAIISITNINTGITYLGIAYLLTALLFILVTQRDKRALLIEDV